MQRKVFDRKVFNRKLVLITGGCAGIGRALAVRMAQAGARLVIFDLHQDALDGLVQHLADHHNAEALGLCCDVSDAEAVQR
ncbi:MAG TPA: short chain dehydrogenase, partial [Pseudomonas sp.]|nr:short chain dehydrogenase [Pseudomonas sp.]